MKQEIFQKAEIDLEDQDGSYVDLTRDFNGFLSNLKSLQMIEPCQKEHYGDYYVQSDTTQTFEKLADFKSLRYINSYENIRK